METKALKIHGFYIILMLIIVIICLLTIQMGSDEKIIGYFSFAGTMTSILLAIIAIIYSFYSNSTMSQSLGSLDSISKDVIKNTLQMTTATENLKAKIEEIPTFLKPIEDKTDIANSRLEQLANRPQAMTSTLTSTQTISAEAKINYLDNSSFLGVKSLYCCLLSLQQSKPFRYSDINALAASNSLQYMYAYCVSSAALGLVQYSMNIDIITTTVVDETIAENLRDIIYRKAEVNDSKASSVTKDWRLEIENIEKFFSI